MSEAVVFLDIEKAFDTTWHLCLLYKFLELKFSINLIKLISSFLSQQIKSYGARWNTYGKGYRSRGATRFLSVPTLYGIYKWYARKTPGVYLGLFADDTCIYTTDRKEGYVLSNLQRCLSATETWSERWNIKINTDKTQPIYFTHRLRPWC
jgi:hypothetical protein